MLDGTAGRCCCSTPQTRLDEAPASLCTAPANSPGLLPVFTPTAPPVRTLCTHCSPIETAGPAIAPCEPVGAG
jgi:hypothetical protein